MSKNILDQDFSSEEEEDEDFTPQPGDGDSEEESKGPKRAKKLENPVSKRRRGGGGILADDEELKAQLEKDAAERKAEEERLEQERKEAAEAERKRKSDALWADLNGGMSRPKASTTTATTASTSGNTATSTGGDTTGSAKPVNKVDALWAEMNGGVTKKPAAAATVSGTSASVAASSTEKASVDGAKVEITKTYDFAGESVTVTKTVDANSKEAQELKKKEEARANVTGAGAAPVKKDPLAALAKGPVRPKGRGGGALGALLGAIDGKKQKMSTVAKSQLDWESYKSKSGVKDELESYKKGNNRYTEKQDFLLRADWRSHEADLAAKNKRASGGR
eukprot:GFYU01006928.1.p1 GENE.GFYU01006928.1~~GFYU01006928.1.p1  ORF type:complete len:336 (+),score=118.88 GFYU01006928.1:132-1139(+)